MPAQRAGWVETCFESYGRDASGSSEYDPAKTIALCRQAGPNASDCIYGAARDYGNNYAGGPDSSRFCAAAPARFRPRCYEGIGTILGAMHRYGAERRGGVQAGDAGALPGRLLPRRRDHVVLGGLAARASLWNRRRKLALFMETMQPGPETRVVDVGVGDTGFGTEPGVASSHNFFEALYPWPERITAVSDVPLPNFAREFPTVSTVTASGTELPFEDDAFDVAFSNAVVEHVGGRDQQRRFVAELCRVAPRVFLSTPNRWFPLETHTLVPLRALASRGRRRSSLAAFGARNWERVELLSEARALGLFPPSVSPGVVESRITISVAAARRY